MLQDFLINHYHNRIDIHGKAVRHIFGKRRDLGIFPHGHHAHRILYLRILFQIRGQRFTNRYNGCSVQNDINISRQGRRLAGSLPVVPGNGFYLQLHIRIQLLPSVNHHIIAGLGNTGNDIRASFLPNCCEKSGAIQFQRAAEFGICLGALCSGLRLCCLRGAFRRIRCGFLYCFRRRLCLAAIAAAAACQHGYRHHRAKNHRKNLFVIFH